MRYNVIVDADGASREQVLAAQQRYLEVLEARLGGPEQVLACFRSWAMVKDKGPSAVHADIDRESSAWILADAEAKKAAGEFLSDATRVQFMFSLR